MTQQAGFTPNDFSAAARAEVAGRLAAFQDDVRAAQAEKLEAFRRDVRAGCGQRPDLAARAMGMHVR